MVSVFVVTHPDGVTPGEARDQRDRALSQLTACGLRLEAATTGTSDPARAASAALATAWEAGELDGLTAWQAAA